MMVLERLLQKRASLASDAVGDIVSPALIGGLPAYTAGKIHGFIGDIDPDEVKQLERSPGVGLLPGVGSSRIVRRSRAVDRAAGDDNGALHRFLGSPVNIALLTLLGAGAGAAAGALYNDSDRGDGALAGAGVGAGFGAGLGGLSYLGGALLAGATKHRNIKEHKASRPSALAHYLIPGRAAYETYKTLGTSEDLGMFPNKVNVKG